MKSRRTFFKNTFQGVLALSVGSAGIALAATSAEGGIRKIPTVTGSVDSDKMGLTLVHEHVLFGDIPKDKENESIDFAVMLLKDAARVGIETIIDLSPTRNIELYQKIAGQVPVNIILSTGAYLKKYMPDYLVKFSEKEFANHIRKELTQGIDNTKIRAGIIKVAGSSTPLTQWEIEKFRAAAVVQKELDVPVATHAIFNPREQFDLLTANGAAPNRLFFSHIEAEFGWGKLTREQMGEELVYIANKGGRLLFNNFGYEFDTPWADLVYLIRNLVDKGYAENVLASMDLYWHWSNGKKIINIDDRYPETAQKTYAYAVTDAIPALLKAGFSSREVNTIFIKNPAVFMGY